MTIVRWTDEQNRLLRELCGRKLVSDAIAAEINRRTGSRFDKNAVIGRARRAGIELPIAAGSHGAAPRFRDAPAPASKRYKPGRLLLRLGWLEGAFR